MAGHPVAGVDGHVQRPQRGDVDERTQELAVGGEHVAVGGGAAATVVLRNPGDHLVADRGQAGVLADGFGARAAEFDAVVGGGVVAGGEHRAGAVQQARGEVQLIGGRQPDADDVEPLRGDSVGEGLGQDRRTGPHVVPDDDLRGGLGPVADQPCERRPDVAHETFVDLLADESAHVIGLDDALHRRGGTRHEAPWDEETVGDQPSRRGPSSRRLTRG
ncbi:hypothetical protein ASJ79_01445 [Mycobacterium sp. NAZ190054]|nr:hypothetical protein ASJ79_01445 [Mycobacterium sp. NAZ190054]